MWRWSFSGVRELRDIFISWFAFSLEAEKSTCLNELDVKKLLVASVSRKKVKSWEYRTWLRIWRFLELFHMTTSLIKDKQMLTVCVWLQRERFPWVPEFPYFQVHPKVNCSAQNENGVKNLSQNERAREIDRALIRSPRLLVQTPFHLGFLSIHKSSELCLFFFLFAVLERFILLSSSTSGVFRLQGGLLRRSALSSWTLPWPSCRRARAKTPWRLWTRRILTSSPWSTNLGEHFSHISFSCCQNTVFCSWGGPRIGWYLPITYYWTVPLILGHSYLVWILTSLKIADTKVSGF